MIDSRYPKKWKIYPFGELVENFDNVRQPLKKAERSLRSGIYPYYGASGIIDYIDDYLFEGEYLLIGEDGANLVARSTPIAFKASGKFWVNNHAHIVQAKSEVLLDYLMRYFNVLDLTPFITGTAQPKLTKSRLKTIPIPLPPLPEQRRIAAILDKADELRAKRRAALDKLDTLLQSIFIDMFGDPSDSPYPIMTLKAVCQKITDGAHRRPTYVESGIPFLRVTDIRNGNIDWDKTKKIPLHEHIELIKRCDPCKGDILYSKNGTIGVPRLIDWDQEFSIFVSLALLRPNPSVILGGYLESFLKTPFALRQAIKHTKSGTVSNLHLVEIRKVKLPVPPLEVQEKWLRLKRKIQIKRQTLLNAAEKLDSLFNSLQQRAFRGELGHDARQRPTIRQASTLTERPLQQ